MTTGQIVFFSGVALLALTIILAIIFIIRKPKYMPGNAIYGEADRNTQKLHNGYPTDRLTIRRELAQSINPATSVLSEGTARSTAEQTEKLIGTEILLEQDIEKIPEGTMPLPDGTVKLQQAEETAQLFGQGATFKGGTEALNLFEKREE